MTSSSPLPRVVCSAYVPESPLLDGGGVDAALAYETPLDAAQNGKEEEAGRDADY